MRPKNVGANLEMNDSLCMVGNPNRFEAFLVIDQVELPYVRVGQTVRIRLDAYANEALVDVIFADGAIVPAVISTVNVSGDTQNKWDAAYSVRIRFLHGRDAYVQSYFDFKKNLVGKIENSQGVLYWHKSDRKTLAETFDNLERYLGPPSVDR